MQKEKQDYSQQELATLISMQRDGESLRDVELRIVDMFFEESRRKGVTPADKIKAFQARHSQMQ